MELALLDPTATLAQIEDICRKAADEKYKQLTVPPLFVKKAKELSAGSGITVSAVIGYPFGWSAIEAKVAETVLAMIDGADELDIVVNITALKNNDWQYLAKEINMLLSIVRKQQKKICFTIETALLTDEEITRCCDLYGAAGIDTINLGTGLQKELPSIETVQSVRSQLADMVAIKIMVPATDKEIVETYQAAGAGRPSLLVK